MIGYDNRREKRETREFVISRSGATRNPCPDCREGSFKLERYLAEFTLSPSTAQEDAEGLDMTQSSILSASQRLKSLSDFLQWACHGSTLRLCSGLTAHHDKPPILAPSQLRMFVFLSHACIRSALPDPSVPRRRSSPHLPSSFPGPG